MSLQVSVLFYPDVEQTRPLVQCLFPALTYLPSSSFHVVKVPIIHPLFHEPIDSKKRVANDLDCSAAVFYICPKSLDLQDRLLIKHFQSMNQMFAPKAIISARKEQIKQELRRQDE